MLRDYLFRVAGFVFRVSMPDGLDIVRLLPSFRPFACAEACGAEDILFHLSLGSEPLPADGCGRVLEVADKDMGHTRFLEHADGFRIEQNHATGSPVHVMHTDSHFRTARAAVRWEDPCAGEVLGSFLRIVYSQAVLLRGGVSIHASAVAWKGRAFLFLGKSGTGKSTHAVQWLRRFPGSELLNDDNPTIRVEEGRGFVYGTPWSGKTPCYKNLRFPIGGIARLRQGSGNRFVLRTDVEAFITLLPGCSAIRTQHDLCNGLYDTLSCLLATVPVGELECLPDEDAAWVCATALGAVE